MGSGEISLGLADNDAVALVGAARPSWRASGLPFLSPHRVPGETLGSSVIFVASLLGGVDWYRCFGGSELGGRSPVGAAATRFLRFFVDRPLSAFVFLVFSLSFLLGVTVLLPPQHLSLDVSVGCFVYKAGETLFQ